MAPERNDADISPGERKGLNAAVWAIIGLPLLILLVTAIAWAIGSAFA